METTTSANAIVKDNAALQEKIVAMLNGGKATRISVRHYGDAIHIAPLDGVEETRDKVPPTSPAEEKPLECERLRLKLRIAQLL